jgi:hypothetical protein
MKIKPLSLSVFFTIVEIIIFVFIAHSSIENSSKIIQYYPSLMGKLLPNFGNLIIAIATTWYVVFTYFILRTTEEMAKKTSEPYLFVNWTTTSEPQEEKFNYEEKVKSEIARHTGSSFYDASDENNTLPGRYINIEIQNERPTVLGVLNINLEIVFIPAPDLKITNLDPISLDWKKERAGIQRGSVVSITVADLAHVPSIFSIEVKIKKLNYTSNDSDSIINVYRGDKVSKYRGIAMIRAAIPSLSEAKGAKIDG